MMTSTTRRTPARRIAAVVLAMTAAVSWGGPADPCIPTSDLRPADWTCEVPDPALAPPAPAPEQEPGASNEMDPATGELDITQRRVVLPEPGGLLMLGIGITILSLVRRVQRR